ncbi:unnamed protein product [marine sediment metagenome]|uniref:Uncharacterized protein n=1 Tax=marine sediment metagenome TaxID=412755 RepID=X0UDP6_9ZZZZ
MANGQGIESAVELEQRLTRIEMKIDAQSARLELYIKNHRAFAERELKRGAETMRVVCDAVAVNTEYVIESKVRWEHHLEDHKSIGRKERTWDVVIGAFAAISAAIGSQIR